MPRTRLVEGLVRVEARSRKRFGVEAGAEQRLVMRRYERTSTVFTSNRAVDEWGKLLGDTTATSALLDRLLHHARVVQCGPKSCF